jgi:hypothetical protein
MLRRRFGARGGEDVNPRHLGGLGLLIAMAVMLLGVPALAAQPAARSADPLMQSVQWSFGPDAPFGGTRFDGELVASQGRIYFLGFRTFLDATDGSIWYYDLGTQTYTDTGLDMPVPVSNYQISMLNDSTGLGLYIFGGRDANAQIIRTVQVYYPLTNTTAVINTDPWPGRTPAGCISLPAMGVATLANKAFVLGGMSFAANGCFDDQSTQTWIFNPLRPAGSRWSAGPPLNVARGYITPAVLGRTIYAIGGDINAGGSLFAQTTVESWQPGGGWNDVGVADLPVGCDEAQAYGFRTGPLANGVVLAGCGQWPNAIPDTHFYSATTNSWSMVGAFNENRRNHAGALYTVGNRPVMYILGGYGEASGFFDPLVTSELGRGGPSSGLPGRTGAGAGGAGSAPLN